MSEDMNMQENARLVLGLRSAGWSEKKINDFYFTSKLEMNSISRHQIRSRKKGWKKSSPTHKKHTKCMCLFEYSTSREERKEEKAMLKILKELGQMEGHFAVEIFKVEELGMIAVDHDTSNGETMEAWKCDSTGAALDEDTPSFRVKEVQEPTSYDEDGEPDQWQLIGFEVE